ncbi:MAG: type II toxin-antitoxin system VapC family toxin [Pseudomonadota bacterium]
MVVDTSAIIAYLANEPVADRNRDALADASECRMSAFNVFECRVVLDRKFGDAMVREFELLLVTSGVEIVPLDADQALLAHRAHRRFGKGTGHPAQLNLGDCAAYALARSSGLPLLFTSDDFAATDVARVL